jgi:hypothetical protein
VDDCINTLIRQCSQLLCRKLTLLLLRLSLNISLLSVSNHETYYYVSVALFPLISSYFGSAFTIIFKHLLACIYLSRTIYLVLNATIFTSISHSYDMFRPQTAIIRCFVYAKTVALYKMYKIFTYLYTCKCDVSCLIHLMNIRYLFAFINFTHFLI